MTRVGRYVYAASSSTHGDYPGLPKVEEVIGRPLSPYAVTKYVSEFARETCATRRPTYPRSGVVSLTTSHRGAVGLKEALGWYVRHAGPATCVDAA